MIFPGTLTYTPAASYDSDADAFFTAAGITDSTQKSAVNQLVLDLKTASIWTKMLGLYPFVGGSASTHKYNLKDPRDLDVAYRLTFGGAWTHDSNGVTGNGSTTYADTHCDLKVATTINSLAIGVYSRTNSTSTQKAWGAYFLNFDSETGVVHPGVQTHLYVNVGTVVFLSDMGDLGGSSNRLYTSNSNTAGFMMANRPSSSVHSIYKNGTKLATNTPSGGGLKTGSYLAFGACYKINGPAYEASDVRNYGLAFMSTGLTDTEASNFYTAVQAFQTTLGRQV